MKTCIMILGLTLFLTSPFIFGSQVATLEQGIAFAQDDLKKEFDETCQIFEDTEQLGKEDLQRLLKRCDNLKLRIEKLEDPQRKVMLSRLKRCRDFYTYLMDIKESEKK